MHATDGVIDNWGDCGSPGDVNLPQGGVHALSDISTAIGLASSGAIATTAIASGVGARPGAAAGALSAIPIIGAIASVALLPIMLIIQHHQKAVSQEQATNCSAVLAFNVLDAIDSAVASGQLSADQANQMLAQLYQQFVTAVAPVSSICSGGIGYRRFWAGQAHGNAACYLKAGALANVQLRGWLYANQPATPATVPVAAFSNAVTAVASTVAQAVGGGNTGLLLIMAIIALIAFLL